MYERTRHLLKQSGYFYTPIYEMQCSQAVLHVKGDSMCPDGSSELSLAVLALVESSLLQVRKVDRAPFRPMRSARLYRR